MHIIIADDRFALAFDLPRYDRDTRWLMLYRRLAVDGAVCGAVDHGGGRYERPSIAELSG